jgi:subtilase family serine protease
VTERVRNLGPDPMPATTVAFYLVPKGAGMPETDGLPSGAIPIGSRGVGAFTGRGVSAATTSVTIPGGTPPGEYWLTAMADSGEVVAERSEANNTKARPIKLGPDLFLPVLRAPAGADAGADIVIADTTKNKGVSTAAATITRYYLSTDPTLDGGDLLLGSRDVPPLSRSQFSRGERTVTLPAAAPGTYYVLAAADASGAVAELAEGNNLKAKRITIREGDKRPQRR